MCDYGEYNKSNGCRGVPPMGGLRDVRAGP